MASYLFLTASVLLFTIAIDVIVSLPATTATLHANDVSLQLLTTLETGHHHHQQRHRHHQQQQHRRKRSVTKSVCAQPSNIEDMFDRIYSELNQTQFLSRPLEGNITIADQDNGQGGSFLPNSQPPSCPGNLSESIDGYLCPHYYRVFQLPEGYYPPTIKVAICTCSLCLNNTGFRCVPVMESVTVLKPVGCFQGLQRYEEYVFPLVPKHCKCSV